MKKITSSYETREIIVHDRFKVDNVYAYDKIRDLFESGESIKVDSRETGYSINKVEQKVTGTTNGYPEKRIRMTKENKIYYWKRASALRRMNYSNGEIAEALKLTYRQVHYLIGNQPLAITNRQNLEKPAKISKTCEYKRNVRNAYKFKLQQIANEPDGKRAEEIVRQLMYCNKYQFANDIVAMIREQAQKSEAR